jgi:hypothetical protein
VRGLLPNTSAEINRPKIDNGSQEMYFIGELIKRGRVGLVEHNLDLDWIPTDIRVIYMSYTGRCNLMFDGHAAV